MKFIFLVQGEGRGHMSQALCLKEKLEKRGHSVSNILISCKSLDSLPSFFTSKINCPIETLSSPSFELDKKKQGIAFGKSIIFSFLKAPTYLNSFKKIKETIKNEKPDALISFYEPLTGYYLRLFNDKTPAFFIGHQYFMNHPVFDKFFDKKLEKIFFKGYNLFSSTKNGTKLCLSFTKEDDVLNKNLFVCPPLIKSEIMNDQKVNESIKENDKYILVYLVTKGYSETIINWSNSNPETKIIAFANSPEKEVNKISDSLTFYNLSGPMFNDKLRNCQAYVSTAGFDSIAEAAYLGKEIMMVPVSNHFEQKYNSFDADRAKIALKANNFDLSLIINKSNDCFSGQKTYKKWCDDYQDKIVEIIERKCQ